MKLRLKCYENIRLKIRRMTLLLLIPLLFATGIVGDNGGILQIHYPNISIEADNNGSIYMMSGSEASVYVLPGEGGSVYYEGEDLLHMIKLINGLPPVWKEHSNTGFFITAFGGTTVNTKLEALDPQNHKLNYSLVAGSMPPGVRLDSVNSRIYGKVPDVDGLYSFTIRATNEDDKYADAVFRMEIIETNQCVVNNPCKHGALCIDTTGDVGYQCKCTALYGGQNCDILCSNKKLGVSNRSLIPDAQMSAHISRPNVSASEGRLGASGQGWCGSNSNSWLQIDLGTPARVFSSTEQSYSSSYYTGSYSLSTSINGVTFDYILTSNSTSSNSTRAVLNGSSDSSSYTALLPDPVVARFVRFHPISYSSSYYPCMRVELNGCYV